MGRLTTGVALAVVAVALASCGDELAELYEANGEMEDALRFHLEDEEGLEVSATDCGHPSDLVYTCLVYVPLDSGTAASAAYRIRDEENGEWRGWKREGDALFPEMVADWW